MKPRLSGGGLNASLGRSAVAGTLNTTSIAPGASFDVQFVLGVQQGGSFRFLVNVEAVTVSANLSEETESNLKAGARKATGGKQQP